MGLLLLSVKAHHQDDQCAEDANRDHEEQEGLVVHVVCCEGGSDLGLVCHIHDSARAGSVANRREPVCVVEHDQDVVVYFVAGKEDIILGAPPFNLGLHNAVIGEEVTSFCLRMLYPNGAGLYVAVVVLLTSEDEHVKAVSIHFAVM